MNKNEKVLVICAHPDDEALGLGGTLALHSKNKDTIHVVIFADGQRGRDRTPAGISERQNAAKIACSILGIKAVRFLNYEDQKLDTVPVVDLATQIESIVEKFQPDIVYTHYWGDVNQDHRRLYEATLIALRPRPALKVKQLICFETPSSTEWGDSGFKPNLYVKIDKVLKKKIKALNQYKKEIGSFPHPRSKASIINRARYWGSSVGVNHAEAFLSVREILRD